MSVVPWLSRGYVDKGFRIPAGGRSKGRISPLEHVNRMRAEAGEPALQTLPEWDLEVALASLPMVGPPLDPRHENSYRSAILRHPGQGPAARKIQAAWRRYKLGQERRSAAALSAMRGLTLAPGRPSVARLPPELREAVLSSGPGFMPDRIGLAGAGYQRRARGGSGPRTRKRATVTKKRPTTRRSRR